MNQVNSSQQFIKNSAAPICKNCAYYILYTHFDTLDRNQQFSKCAKYGTKYLISGKVDYHYASMCRDDESKCGQNGMEFVKYESMIGTKWMILQNYILSTFSRGLSISDKTPRSEPTKSQ